MHGIDNLPSAVVKSCYTPFGVTQIHDETFEVQPHYIFTDGSLVAVDICPGCNGCPDGGRGERVRRGRFCESGVFQA